jgi:hypothetical protein
MARSLCAAGFTGRFRSVQGFFWAECKLLIRHAIERGGDRVNSISRFCVGRFVGCIGYHLIGSEQGRNVSRDRPAAAGALRNHRRHESARHA